VTNHDLYVSLSTEISANLHDHFLTTDSNLQLVLRVFEVCGMVSLPTFAEAITLWRLTLVTLVHGTKLATHSDVHLLE